MSRSRHLASPAAALLLVLFTQVTACQPEQGPGPEPVPGPEQEPGPGETPAVQTSPYTLTASPRATDTSTEPPGSGAVYGLLTTNSALGILDFRYDAYVLTAQESGTVVIQSDVLEANPNSYPYGYAYPLSMAVIEDGVTFTAYGGSYLQNALDTGTAIMDYPIQKGRQYILVYKAFGAFTPLKYRLKLPSSLIVEGRIHAPPEPVIAPQNSTGHITLENPRPDALKRLVPSLSDKVKDG